MVQVREETITEERRIAAHIIIKYGEVQPYFTRKSFHRTKTGGFGSLKKGQPLKRRTDRGEELDIPPVPFWQAVNMARARFKEVEEKVGPF